MSSEMIGADNGEKIPLGDIMPQAEPMILLTDYDTPSDDESVDAYVSVSESSPFYEGALGGVPGCVALEYMAQAMALCTGFYRRRKGLPPKIGFVLGSRRMTVGVPRFACGERYRVHATCTYFDESFGSFDCAVFDASGAEVARAQLTAFQPEGDMTPEKLEEFQ